jgi:uncharacterized protein YecT (DUF1311 family)
MKSHLKFAALIALLFTLSSIPVHNAHAEEKFEKFDAKDQAAVDKANKVLEGVYGELMSKTEDSQEKTSLRNAQRAWIIWRDTEAEYIGRHGGAVGGSALRGDFAVAQLKLINERIAVLKAYAAQAPKE